MVMREAAMPNPNRAQRLRRSTMEVENLFHRSAARDDSTTGQQNKAFRSVPQRSAPNDQPAVLNDRDVGVPLSQEVLEGQVPSATTYSRPQADDDYLRLQRDRARSQGGASDARGVGARRGPGNFTTGRTGAVDARSLGARPETRKSPIARGGAVDARNVNRSPVNMEEGLNATNLNEVSQEYGEDTMGLEPRQRYPIRQSRPGFEQNEAPRMGSTRDSNDFQGRLSQENRFQHNGPRVEGDFGARHRGGSNTLRERGSQAGRGGAQSGRGGRPRASRSNQGDEPRQRKRNREAASGNEYGGKISVEEMYNEEEKEYAKQKRKREATQSIAYEPGDVSRHTFSGVGPAVVSGEWGMSEVLGERLLLARKYLDGEYVEWHSKEQKADVMTLVERLKAEKKSNPLSSPSAEAEQQTQRLMQKLLGGKYEFTEPQQGKDILGNVARHTDRNESYFPVDQQSLLEKVRSLMPANDKRKDKRT